MPYNPNILSDLSKDLPQRGKVEKAVITLYEYSATSKDPNLDKAIKPGLTDENIAAFVSGKLNNDTLSAYTEKATRQWKEAEEKLRKAKEGLTPDGDTPTGDLNKEIDQIDADRFDYHYKQRQYQVMFNPSSLKLTASGGGLVAQRRNLGGENDKVGGVAIVYVPDTNKNIMLNVNLIFDQVNPSDAFAQVNPFETAGNVKSLVNAYNTIKGKDYSIQQDVEGFLSACRRPGTRYIRFSMGDMSYAGVLYQVSANYTMFNPTGEPIRAVVYLSMTLIDTKMGYNDMGQFTESFQQVFQNKTQSLNTLKNKAGAFLNLDL